MVDYFKKYIKGSYWAFFDKLAEKIFADALDAEKKEEEKND